MKQTKNEAAKSAYFASCLAIFGLLQATPAFATTGDLPWSASLDRIANNMTGPTATAVSLIVIIVTTLSLAFSEASGGSRKLLGLALCLAGAHQATSVVSLFGGGTGVLF